MNRLSRWVLGVGLVSMLLFVTACSSGNSQTPAPSAQQSSTAGESSGATGAGGTGTVDPSSPESSTGTDASTSNEGAAGSNTESGSTAAPTQGSNSTGSSEGSTNEGNTSSKPSNNANPELTPKTTELKISTVQQGPGQLFLRVDEMPKGYGVSKMEWESQGYSESATFDQAVQNGKNGKDGFFASSDQRNFGFIYNGSHSGQAGRVTLTLRNSNGDELTWYDDVVLQ
ncbi:hypothetical protein [Paenibacillus campi]|uniref:hypothetical protein n=1 Tax=Paenibacillus campi TaxID=3106031 RepID=UPI002AFE71DB|nr:hypothetical protein [Paenibacillus sp. SGZ-1014]